ncbi:hypothetical protein DL770_000331 [Monosporascus sp. CRB-9-2]|nr:hypothetical protein DL770_000331 [Monosporascus sp. CRB-9-2]
MELIMELLDEQAKHLSDRSALGFANFSSQDSKQLATDDTLARIIGSSTSESSRLRVGLMFMSSPDSVLTWLGLQRLRCNGFLPQLDSAAIYRLRRTCSSSIILIDESGEHGTAGLRDCISFETIPPYCKSGKGIVVPSVVLTKPRKSDIAYLGFTPDVQCYGLVLSGGPFSITGTNAVNAVEHACEKSSVHVRYFSSVPYVHQLLASEDDGTRLLQSMDLVGVGDAALPAAVGDELLARDMRLVSRMGSAVATPGDAQITLSNGKKFDPSPMEGAILTSTSVLRDILILVPVADDELPSTMARDFQSRRAWEAASAAYERVSEALLKRGLPVLERPGGYSGFNEYAVCLPCVLPDANHDFSGGIRERILGEATVFIHAARAVNFSIRLSSSKITFVERRNRIKYAMRAATRFLFHKLDGSPLKNISRPSAQEGVVKPIGLCGIGIRSIKIGDEEDLLRGI